MFGLLKVTSFFLLVLFCCQTTSAVIVNVAVAVTLC